MTKYTPAQRALLQLLESLLISAIIAGLFSASTLIMANGPIDWNRVAYTFGLAAVISVGHSLTAYFRPSDVPLSEVIDGLVQAVEKRYQTQPIPGIQGPLVVVHPSGATTVSTPPTPLPEDTQPRPVVHSQPS